MFRLSSKGHREEYSSVAHPSSHFRKDEPIHACMLKLRRKKTHIYDHFEGLKENAALQVKARQETELAERKARLDAAQKRAAEAATEVAKLQAEMEAGSSG